jgi:hypothetical protein
LAPSEALTILLKNAQQDHAKCVASAQKAGEDVVEKCNLTWGEVYLRYKQFGAYRAPFHDTEASNSWNKFWTKKRQDADDKRLF